MKLYGIIALGMVLLGLGIAAKTFWTEAQNAKAELALAQEANKVNSKTIEELKAQSLRLEGVLAAYNVDMDAIKAGQAATDADEKRLLVNNETVRAWHGNPLDVSIVELFNNSLNRISDGAKKTASGTTPAN